MMPYPIDKPLHLTFDLEKIINREYNKNSLWIFKFWANDGDIIYKEIFVLLFLSKLH